MTTIATDGVTIAADGLRTRGGERRGTSFAKIRVVNNCIYALSGLVPLFEPLIAWHQQGANPRDFPALGTDSEWGTLVVIDRDGIGKISHTCPHIERYEPPIAFGAGDDYAMGAMMAGASPERAVQIVAELCVHTGGEITVINIAEALGQKRLAVVAS